MGDCSGEIKSRICEAENALTYLLILGRCGDDVVHQDRHKLGDPVDAGGEGAIRGIAIDDLALVFGLLQPFSGYRIYNIEYAEFVCAGSLLEVRENLLDEERLGLNERKQSVYRQRCMQCTAVQSTENKCMCENRVRWCPYLNIRNTEVGNSIDLRS